MKKRNIKRWTGEVRFDTIWRGLCIAGVVSSDDKGSKFAVNAMLKKRMAEGTVKRRVEGRAVYYRGVKG